MSCALVCQTAKGDCETSISPPFSGVVATTSKVGSTIVSARAAVRRRNQQGEAASGRERQPSSALMRDPSCAIVRGRREQARPGGTTPGASQAPARDDVERLRPPRAARYFNDWKICGDQFPAVPGIFPAPSTAPPAPKRASTTTPPPAGEPMVTSPPSSRTRSRIPASPIPASGSPFSPRPSSATRMTNPRQPASPGLGSRAAFRTAATRRSASRRRGETRWSSPPGRSDRP